MQTETPAGKGPDERRVGRPGPMRLAADVARCGGYENEEGDLREGCDDCLRRTDRGDFPMQSWMAPPLIVVFECEARIPP